MTDPTEPVQDCFDAPSAPLAAILAEVRDAEPSIDWERLESRLFDESGAVRKELVEAPAAEPRASRSARVAVVASGLAIAAAFAFALISPTRAPTPATHGGAPAVAHRSPLLFDDARPASVGERVVGGASGTWIRAQGRVAIRVEPGAVVRVLDDGERVRLALESGAVAADVVPVAGGEPYAVDVLGRRVAVHGTHLRVAIVPSAGDQAIEVAVSEGSGVVGAPREGRTEGTLVPAGAVGTFAPAAAGPIAPGAVVLDAERAKRLVEGSLAGEPAPSIAIAPSPVVGPSEPTSKATAPKQQPIAVIAPVDTSAGPQAAVDEPPVVKPGLSSAQLAAPLAKVTDVLQACAPHKGAGVTASFATTLTLHVDPQGRVSDFKAELDPTMRECFRVNLAKVTFPSAEGSTVVTRPIVLGAK